MTMTMTKIRYKIGPWDFSNWYFQDLSRKIPSLGWKIQNRNILQPLLRPGQYRIKAEDNYGNYSAFKTINISTEVQVINFVLDKVYLENLGLQNNFCKFMMILTCLLICYM